MGISMMSRARGSISVTSSAQPTPMRLHASGPPTPNRLDATGRQLERGAVSGPMVMRGTDGRGINSSRLFYLDAIEALALLSFFQPIPPVAYASVAVRDQTKLMLSLYGPAELFIRRSATA